MSTPNKIKHTEEKSFHVVRKGGRVSACVRATERGPQQPMHTLGDDLLVVDGGTQVPRASQHQKRIVEYTSSGRGKEKVQEVVDRTRRT